MTTQEQSVPKYFADFVQENARQHQELAARISGVETALTARISGVESLGARISGVEKPGHDRPHQRCGDSLGTRISGVEGELRIIKAVSVAMLGAMAATFAAVSVAVIKYVFGL